MNVERDRSLRERDTDGWPHRLLLPILISALTSFVGGAAGGYITLQIHEYRIGQLETHVKEDQQRFADTTAHDILLSNEMATIRERHRREDMEAAIAEKKIRDLKEK